LPTIYTTELTNITSTTAASGGYVSNSGGATITARGVCWSTSTNPTIANSQTSNGTGVGGYISNLTGLSPNTLYFVRAYATNSAGTGYGNERSFTTLCANPVTVSVSITTSANPVCAGSSVTFTATPTNGGSSPVYQWKVNGINVGSNSSAYTFTPLNNDVVTCVLTSNLACVSGNPATSNAITMTVNPSSSVGVTIAASANPVCAGATVTYAATPVNGGSTPIYLWKVNGNTVNGASTSTYTYIPVNNDAVTCQMTSNLPCVVNNPAMSNIINMTVNPITPVSVSIVASENPVNSGTTVTFTATPTNGGSSPAHQWKVNGANVGTNSNSYSYIPANNDSITCVVTSSQNCVSGNPAISNKIIMIVNSMDLPCPGTPTVSYGGKTYNTVLVGDQCWLKENLNIGALINGSENQSQNDIFEKYCYNNLESNCSIYGGLYQWDEMRNYDSLSECQGICPEGWHIPSDNEWTMLTNFLGGENTAGGKLKEVGLSHWFSPNLGATNSSHFTCLPAGQRVISNNFFENLNIIAPFWSSTENSLPDEAWARNMSFNQENISKSTTNKLTGNSVRCLKNCLTTPEAPTVGIQYPSQYQIIWNWYPAINATGYKWNTTNDFFTATDIGNISTKTETNLICNTLYTRYIWAYNDCGHSSVVIISQSTSNIPLESPAPASHLPAVFQIVWKWNSVNGAAGYKWNTINDITSATTLGTEISHLETSLNCDSTYQRYIWAFNNCGSSISTVLVQSTYPCTVTNCASSVTVNHLAGNVAPVTKTVTYGIVTNVPGEESKCWLTQNLGSSNQAIGFNDISEASAGWYWQFNLKQGYKHDGFNRTPNNTWITTISENSDWLQINDPCNIELGGNWRIPSYTEWFNVSYIGNWQNGYDIFNSSLKIHASGQLSEINGGLYSRGAHGLYWTNMQVYLTEANYFHVTNSGPGYSFYRKACGYTIRCIQD
jgi:uncharacterized protein (TIGR02145 family)